MRPAESAPEVRRAGVVAAISLATDRGLGPAGGPGAPLLFARRRSRQGDRPWAGRTARPLPVTHPGERQGFAATGRRLVPPAIDLFRIVDDWSAEVRVFYDTVELMQRLGVSTIAAAAAPHRSRRHFLTVAAHGRTCPPPPLTAVGSNDRLRRRHSRRRWPSATACRRRRPGRVKRAAKEPTPVRSTGARPAARRRAARRAMSAGWQFAGHVQVGRKRRVGRSGAAVLLLDRRCRAAYTPIVAKQGRLAQLVRALR